MISNAVDQSMPGHLLSVVLVHNITLTSLSSYAWSVAGLGWKIHIYSCGPNQMGLFWVQMAAGCLPNTSKLWIKYSINTKSTIQELLN